MSVQNLALQRNAFVLQNSGLTPRIETLDVVLRQNVYWPFAVVKGQTTICHFAYWPFTHNWNKFVLAHST